MFNYCQYLVVVAHNKVMDFNHQLDAGNMSQTKELVKLAAAGRYSERHFRRLIKYETGKTPGQIFRIERLQRAGMLLATTALPVTDIVFRSGFFSVRQFNTAFRKFYGVSPHQLRQFLLTPVGAS